MPVEGQDEMLASLGVNSPTDLKTTFAMPIKMGLGMVYILWVNGL